MKQVFALPSSVNHFSVRPTLLWQRAAQPLQWVTSTVAITGRCTSATQCAVESSLTIIEWQNFTLKNHQIASTNSRCGARSLIAPKKERSASVTLVDTNIHVLHTLAIAQVLNLFAQCSRRLFSCSRRMRASTAMHRQISASLPNLQLQKLLKKAARSQALTVTGVKVATRFSLKHLQLSSQPVA